MKKRILTIAAILLAIALVCVCTLPIKTEIYLSLPGGRIDFEGNLISEETVTMSGTWKNYLLREDTLWLEFDFPELKTHNANREPYSYEVRDGILRQDYGVYVGEWNQIANCDVYLPEDGTWYLVRLNNRLFYGSAEGGPTPAEIIAITGMTK